MRGGNAYFIKNAKGNIVLMAENIKGTRPATVGFKRRYRKAEGIKRLARGADVPIAVLVPRVQLKKRLERRTHRRRSHPAPPPASRSSCGWWTEMANRISILVALEGATRGSNAPSHLPSAASASLANAKTAGDKAAAGMAEVKAGMNAFGDQVAKAKTQLLAFLTINWAAGKVQEIVQIADA